MPDYPLIRRFLLGEDFVVHTQRLREYQTNKRGMASFSNSFDPCFIGRITAMLQYTQLTYLKKSTRRRMTNAAIPKHGRFEKEWARLNIAPTAMRGKDQGQDHQTGKPMAQGPSRWGRDDDDKASVGGVLSLDIVLLDKDDGLKTVAGTTETAVDLSSTLDPPPAFTNTNRSMPEKSSPGKFEVTAKNF